MIAVQIMARNPDHGLSEVLSWLCVAGLEEQTRNGVVLAAPAPCTVTFTQPHRRVSQSSVRDANPFFHLYESLWMLAGRNDVQSVARYASNMRNFSDDGEVLHGAYGFRWREFFAEDQLLDIIELLRKDKQTRRAVLTMWSPNGDLTTLDGLGGQDSKDLPCNTHIYFRYVSGRLDMTVCNRSNDAVWGLFGANVVHMSMLHEYVSIASGLELGYYHQMTNNLHVYTERADSRRYLVHSTIDAERKFRAVFQTSTEDPPQPLILQPICQREETTRWLSQCEEFAENPDADCSRALPFFKDVASPMMLAHKSFKEGDFDRALHLASHCCADDWKAAAIAWITRRKDRK